MHIPDGFLDAKTALTMAGLSTLGLGIALRHTRKHLPPHKVPLLGLAAAFVFAAQMLNFPVAAGTSGHLIGAVLTAVLLCPASAVIVITCVLLVQCLLFADGGVTTLGANIFNMAIVAGVGGWLIYAPLTRIFPGIFGRILAASFASWVAVVVAAVVCSAQLAASHTVPWATVFPAMTTVHMFIGIGEAIITALVVAAVARSRPDLLNLTPTTPAPIAGSQSLHAVAGDPGTPPSTSTLTWPTLIILGLLISIALAVFVSPFASTAPDGLDKTAQLLAFEHNAAPPAFSIAPAPDYHAPLIASPTVATSVAGLVGTLIVFILAVLLARSLSRPLTCPISHPPDA
jgi:cobalt/nickel transport system permease protein